MTDTNPSGVIPVQTLQRITRLLEAHPWRFARTMPLTPHFYTLRREWERDAEFVEVVRAIREYGGVEIYKRRPYVVLNVNGWRYWTMGAPIPATILINRRKVDGPGTGE